MCLQLLIKLTKVKMNSNVDTSNNFNQSETCYQPGNISTQSILNNLPRNSSIYKKFLQKVNNEKKSSNHNFSGDQYGKLYQNSKSNQYDQYDQYNQYGQYKQYDQYSQYDQYDQYNKLNEYKTNSNVKNTNTPHSAVQAASYDHNNIKKYDNELSLQFAKAAEWGDIDEMKKIIKKAKSKGTLINFKYDKNMAFRHACYYGYLDAAKYILEESEKSGSSINIREFNDWAFIESSKNQQYHISIWLATLCSKYKVYVDWQIDS